MTPPTDALQRSLPRRLVSARDQAGPWVALPPTLRRLLVLATVGLALWIRLLPLALDGVGEPAVRLARERIAARLAVVRTEEPAAGDRERRIDAWITAHPDAFARARDAAAARLRAAYRYRGRDGRTHVYLGDYDSYLWLRDARNYLRSGSTCDAVVAGQCRDTYATAPVGAEMRYARSLHVAAIVGLHRILTLVRPQQPLSATAFLVPVIVGALAVLPAFGIGRLLAGDLGGLFAAIVATLNPLVLARSVGSDNDVWNLVLPLLMVWAAMRALAASRPRTEIAWAVLAGGVVGVHAAVWRGWIFAYAVALCGLGGALIVRGARALFHARGDGAVGDAARVLAAFVLAAALACAIAVPEESPVGMPARILGEVLGRRAEGPPHPGTTVWPAALDTVAELTQPGRSEISVTMGGPLYVFAAWLGLLAMLLPPRAWQWWHFLLLIGGNYLYLHLITGPEVGRGALVLLLASPLVAAAILEVTADRRRGADVDPTRGGRLLVALWLLAAFFYAYAAARFVLLLAAPLGICVGVAAGRLHAWLDRGVARLPRALARPGRVVVPLVLALGLVRPVERADDIMDTTLPEISDAWWNTLVHLRDETPPDAIVITWWDYGHWVKYVAERRTTADGSTLLTHVPHWLARALLSASEEESLGILRMLSCGSDATPEPEGRLGAWGKLVAHGVDEREAYTLLLDVVRRDAAAARAVLAARGLDEPATRDVLASTHCTPPPAYLVLSSEMIAKSSWRYLGARAPVARDDAGDDRARGKAFLRRDWIACTATGTADEVACPLERLAGGGTLRGAFTYRRSVPAEGRLVLHARAEDGESRPVREWTPAAVVVATDEHVDERTPPAAGDPDLGVLIDAPSARVLLGAPEVVRSAFVRLLFLDGRGMRHFAKRDERRTPDGTRVVTWQLRW